VTSAVALMNYISSGILWRIFCQTRIFAGFSLHIINNAVRISEATMSGVGAIIFSAWFFLYLFAEKISEAAMGRTGVWGHNMINMAIRELLYYTFADFFQNWNFSFVGNIFFRVQRSLIRVQHSSVGCSVAHKG
jgi:hypothetical protein